MRTLGRRLIYATLAVVVGLAVLHTPVGRSALLSLTTTVLDRYGVRLDAAELELNLLTLEVALHQVTVSPSDQPDPPLLDAVRVRVDLPWSVATGTIAFSQVDLDGATLTLVQAEDGGWNTPGSDDEVTDQPPPEEGDPFVLPSLGRVRVRDFALNVRGLGYDVAAGGIDLDVDTVADRGPQAQGGQLRLTQPMRVGVGDRSTSVGRLEASFSLDAQTLTVESVEAELPEGRLSVTGGATAVFDEPRLELDYDVDVTLGEAARWWRPDHQIEGRAQVRGQIEGPVAALVITTDVATEALRWGNLPATVRTRTELSGDVLEIGDATIELGDGAIVATGRVEMGEQPGESRVDIAWRQLDTARLLGELGIEASPAPGAVLSGSTTASWTALDPRTMRVATELRSVAAVGSDDAIPIAGAARFELADGSWRGTLDAVGVPGLVVSGDLSGMFPASEQSLTDSTLAGGVVVEVTDVTAVAVALDVLALAGDGETPGASGTATIRADLSGVLGAPRVDGRLENARLSYRGFDDIELRAAFSAAGDGVTMEELVGTAGPNRLSASARWDPGTDALQARVNVDVEDLSTLAPVLPGGLDPSGRLAANLMVSGSTAHPVADIELTGDELTLAGRAIEGIEGDVALNGTLLAIRRLELRQGPGTARVQGTYSLADGAHDLTASGEELSLAALLGAVPEDSDLRGAIRFDVRSAGSLDAPVGSGSLTVDDLDWAGRALGSTDLGFVISDGQVRLDLAVPSLSATAVAELGLGDDTSFELSADLVRTDLGLIAPDGGTPDDSGDPVDVPPWEVRGLTTLRARARGSRDSLMDTEVTLDFEELEALLGLTSVRLVDPGSVRYEERALTTERLELAIGETRLTVTGSLGDDPESRLTTFLRGDLADFAALAVADAVTDDASSALVLGGELTSEVVVAGSIQEPDVDAQVQLRNGRVISGELPPVTEVELDLAYDMEALRLERLTTTWQGASLDGHGVVPSALLADWLPAFLRRPASTPGGADLTLTATGITEALLEPFVDADTLADLQTTVSARLDVQADTLTVEALRARLVLDQLELTMAAIPVTQNTPTELRVEDGRLTVGSWIWSGLGNDLSIGGSVELTGSAPVADLTVTGEGDLRVLGAFGDGLATAGRAFAIVNLQGTLDDPIVRGAIEITDAELRVAEPPLLISELGGSIWLEGNQIRSYELTGQANGGDVRVDAQFELTGLQPSGTLTFTGRQLALEVPTGLRTEVDSDITFDTTRDQSLLTGTVTVLRGDYRETLNLTTGLLAALQQQQQVTVIGQDEPSALDALLLDLRVVTDEDVVVDNNYASGTIGMDLRVVGTASDPGLTGRLSVREGAEIRFGNNVYEVESGEIDFLDPTGIVPELNITAQTRVSSYQVTLGLTGPPEELTTSLQSEPPLGESDIVSLLLTGRTLDQVGSAPGAIARDQALGLMSGELQTAGRAVGLDTVRVESEVGGSAFTTDSTLVAGETDPGSRLTFGKNLSDEVQLIVSQNLRETGLLTWIVDYLPRRDFEIRGVNDDVNDRSYEFRHSVTFGEPPTRARRSTVREARPDLAVGSVTFAGDPGFAEEELRDRIRVRANDPFVFRRWLQDRDRLERFYRERGYLEMQLRARRIDDTPGMVSLIYEIERGPLTVLTVEGYDLSNRTRDLMREAWSTAVFDAFLLERLDDLARRELVEEAYLDATIESEVLLRSDIGEKEIQLRIEPGVRYAERALAFSGNQRVLSSELETYLDALGLRATAWIEPRPVVSALVSLYRGLGFLDAEASVGSPLFEGERATLPIEVRENRAYQIASVSFEGAESLGEGALRAAANLTVGERYTDALVQQARSQVSVRYRQAGFTRSRVAIQSTIDQQAGFVDVVVQVDEGPRQVVEEVVVDGAARTRPELVSRALQLDVGQPVDIAAWNQARRRLYETGAFRSVDIEAQPVDVASDVESGETQPVRARVLLQEWPTFRVRYGVQLKDERAPIEELGREFNLGAVADITHQNFLGRAATVGSAVRYDADQRALRGFMTFRRFFGLPLTSNVFASRLREEFSEFEFVDDTSRLTLEQRFKPNPDLTIAYSYNLSRSITEAIPFDPQFTDPAFWIARLNTSAVIDTRDDIFNATAGWFHSSTLEYSPEFFRSDLTFAKYSMQQYYYRNVGSGVVLASAARLGLGAGLAGQTLITAERFFAGGGNTVRGYAQDSLGPFFGGDALVVLNQEVRFPLISILRGVGFVDAGNTFERIKDLSFGDLEVGAGFGLRADTPFGLFRFDIGFPVSTPDRGNPRFYFSVGQAF